FFNGFEASTFNNFSQIVFAFAVTPTLLAVGVGYALLMGLIGGLLPAFRAMRIPIAAALRGL
ncbi:MAG TPA: ABC transporter permease, partial [Gammaproteobacteria bacterium]|nr:ABC transporter permease [Gammaproteobacteria bacterium]